MGCVVPAATSSVYVAIATNDGGSCCLLQSGNLGETCLGSKHILGYTQDSISYCNQALFVLSILTGLLPISLAVALTAQGGRYVCATFFYVQIESSY
jgi:hypothetical protein